VADRPDIDPVVYRLAGTHGIADAYSNLFSPLLPAIIPRLNLSLAAAGFLIMLYQLAGSVSQLAFGPVADRWKPRVFLVAGPILSVSVLSLVGLAWSPATLAAVLVVGGLGGAAFHPTAAAVVHRMGGSRRGLAMAIHITGGSIGYAIGPLLFAPYVGRFGLTWTPLLAVPGLLLLAWVVRGMPALRPLASGTSGGFRGLRPHAKPLFLLWIIVVLRTTTALSIATFVPVMLTGRGWSVGLAGIALSVYLTAGSLGGFAGGPLADRFGPKRVIAASLLMATPLLAAATLLHDWPLVVVLALGGFFLQSTLPVNVSFAQQIAPAGAATVSSLMLGVAWGIGGLMAPLVGSAADRFGIGPTLTAVAFLPLVASAFAAPLPLRAEPPSAGETT